MIITFHGARLRLEGRMTVPEEFVRVRHLEDMMEDRDAKMEALKANPHLSGD